MQGFLALVAPVALILPSSGDLAQNEFMPDRDGASADTPVQLDPQPEPLTQSEAISGKRRHLEGLYEAPVQYQVRIEQRVVVRISPQQPVQRNSLMAEQAQPRAPLRFEERPMPSCVSVRGIAGVQPGSGNRLVLHLSDSRMVSARLDKSCRARDFYSGFYLEKNEDGKLCVGRDKLQSRSGANCELTRMRELVAVDP